MFFTGMLWLATHRLWGATRKLVENAELTSQRQLRAYVFLDPDREIRIVKPVSTTELFEVDITVRNGGLTPAYEVEGSCWVTLERWPLQGEDQLPKVESLDGPRSKHFLPNGGTLHYHTGTARPLTAEELDAVLRGDLRIYIYGSVSYRDTFGFQRETRFCFASTTEGRQGHATAIARCHLHNEAT